MAKELKIEDRVEDRGLENLDFIRRSRIIHGDKYLYDKCIYKNCREKVRITCPKHGDFLQLPCNHLKGGGCRKCGFSTRWARQKGNILGSRKPVGITGKLWRPVSEEDRLAFRQMIDKGFSLRDIGTKYNRDHGVVSYALKNEKELIDLRKDLRHKRLIAKKIKPPEQVRLRAKLNSCISQARSRSERKNFSIDIDIHFLLELFNKQNGLCALTGIKMEITNNPGQRTNPYAISLDRIDSSLGYTRNNVRLTIWALNHMMAQWGEKFFEKISK